MNSDPANDNYTVFIGSVDSEITIEQLSNFIKEKCQLPYQPAISQIHERFGEKKKNNRYTFVKCRSFEEVEWVTARLNAAILGKARLRVMEYYPELCFKLAKANLFVSRLSLDVEESHLLSSFSCYGRVLSTKISRGEDGVSNGYGYVQLSTEAAAVLALRTAGPVIKGITAKVEQFQPSHSRTRKYGVFLKGFPKSWTEENLKEKLQEKNLVEVVLPRDNKGFTYGYAFANYSDEESAAAAVEEHAGSSDIYVRRSYNRRRNSHLVKICIRGLDASISEQDIHELFADYEPCHVEPVVGCSSTENDCAFVMCSLENAHRAVKALDGTKYARTQKTLQVSLKKSFIGELQLRQREEVNDIVAPYINPMPVMFSPQPSRNSQQRVRH